MRQRTLAITGAASGIGKATATLAVQRGWRVWTIDRSEGDVHADLATIEGRKHMIATLGNLSGGSLDAVIACAGVAPPSAAPVPIIQINFFGALATLEGLRPLLTRGQAPRAVAVSSWASIQTVEAALVDACLADDEPRAIRLAAELESPHTYASSKAALARWLRRHALSPEWLDGGILLNAIAPGLVVTPMTRNILENPEIRAAVETFMPRPLERDAEPSEIAELLHWLVSPANSMIVGQVIFVDGGSELAIRGDSHW